MVPCPTCQKLCGVRDAVLRNERLYYRCSQCMDCFDVVAALQGTPSEERPSAPKRGPKFPMPESRYNPVFKLEGESTRELTPSLATVIASRDASPREVTPTMAVATLEAEPEVLGDSDPTPLQTVLTSEQTAPSTLRSAEVQP